MILNVHVLQTRCTCFDMLLFDLLDVRRPEEIADILNLGEHSDVFASTYRQGQLYAARIDGFHGVRMVNYQKLLKSIKCFFWSTKWGFVPAKSE